MLHDCCAGSEGRDGLLRRATGSLGALLQLAMGAPKHEGNADKAPWGPRIRRPSHVDLARLDSCTCGPHGCAFALSIFMLMLPFSTSASAQRGCVHLALCLGGGRSTRLCFPGLAFTQQHWLTAPRVG